MKTNKHVACYRELACGRVSEERKRKEVGVSKGSGGSDVGRQTGSNRMFVPRRHPPLGFMTTFVVVVVVIRVIENDE